jgi:hypothetical protein
VLRGTSCCSTQPSSLQCHGAKARAGDASVCQWCVECTRAWGETIARRLDTLHVLGHTACWMPCSMSGAKKPAKSVLCLEAQDCHRRPAAWTWAAGRRLGCNHVTSQVAHEPHEPPSHLRHSSLRPTPCGSQCVLSSPRILDAAGIQLDLLQLRAVLCHMLGSIRQRCAFCCGQCPPSSMGCIAQAGCPGKDVRLRECCQLSPTAATES